MNQLYTVGEFAKLTGTTVRTLRYYHKKKLLVPTTFNKQGHRLYRQEDLFLYQRIITFKYLDFSLDQIAHFLENPEINLTETISFQKRMLVEKQKSLQKVIESLETVEKMLGETGEADPELILSFIQTFQQGEERRQWLSSFLSKELVDVLFALETQKKYWLLITELTNVIHTHSPSSEYAKEKVTTLFEIVESIFTPEMLVELEQNADKIKDAPPFLMDEMSTKLEQFLYEMQKEMQNDERRRADDKSTS
ncbi:MerR family transcriptional regulator [Alkalicoccobacillus porphyridii]|uniref:MerR family transcriptional regulator n=1 Tax=Alkalicoccobacillus porphyridii TaxID=2597270 RepID=A0A553ZVN8_9BACI|nr:MerR family transcriptional regulator [Alkalicoccobacillus porphyridii]TSB45493.1 MerR family transcriptional regulator [Alkalicoccobacillus porphyridii]